MTTRVTMPDKPMFSAERLEFVPDFAYFWRPYANPDNIAKSVRTAEKDCVFVIDPWTQRWLITEEPVSELLKLADGRTRLSAIARDLASRGLSPIPGFASFADVAVELRQRGLLFDTAEEHRSSGQPVYQSADPEGLHVEITNACNMSCEHCYVSSGVRLTNEMSFREITKTIDMLEPSSGKRVAISGGEPAVRKDCGDIVEYCVSRGHAVDLYTNAKRFPKKLAQRLLDLEHTYGKAIRLQVSLEGASPETNDRVRGAGSFEAAMKSLAMFGEMDLNRSVVIFVCLTKVNIHEVDDLIALAENLDVSMLVFSQWQRQGNASGIPWASIAPTTEEWVAIGEKLLQYENPRLHVTGNFYGDLRNLPAGRFSLDSPYFPKHLYFYNVFPRITPNGEIFADQMWVDPDWSLGNVRSSDLSSAFESEKFLSQLAAMRDRTSQIEECSRCEWLSLCKGGSPGHTYAEFGDMNHRDMFCNSRIYWFNRYVEHQVRRHVGSPLDTVRPEPDPRTLIQIGERRHD